MFTAAERNALILTVTFLLLGAGIKAWVRAQVELGPFPAALPLGPDTPSPTTVSSGPGTPGGGSGSAAQSDSSPMDQARADSFPADTALPGPVNTHEAGSPAPPSEGRSGRPREFHGPGTDSPSGERTPKAARKQPPRGKVDLNRASGERLAVIPGIGPRTAEAIVAYRRAKGGIRDVRELLEVKGIGEKKLERIAPWVTASGDEKPILSAQTEPAAGADSAGEVGLVSP